MANNSSNLIGQLGKTRYLILGLDPGIASCGFALIDIENEEILEMGSRLFDSPIVPKTKQSKAVVRRGFRSTRRNNDRTKDRLKHCLKAFKEAGIVPDDATAEYFHTKKGDLTPVELRAEGLDRLLTNRELSIVLYSLCKRRGYIPQGEGGADEVDSSSDDGKVLKAISQNNQLLSEGNYRTVGEWLNTLDKSRNAAGSYDRCVSHSQLIDEVHTLFDSQRALGNKQATALFEERYLNIFNWLRPREAFDEKSYSLVGRCVYFPDQKRAARCTLTSELVAAYGAFGNVVIVLPDGKTRTLSADERDEFIGILFSPVALKGNKDCKVTFSSIRKHLDIESRATFKGISSEDEKTREVYIPQGWRILRKTLGKQGESGTALLERLRSDRDLADSILEAVAYSSASSVLESKLELLSLDSDEVNLLLKLPYSNRALNGYGSRSKKALDLLLDSFEEPEILSLTDAEEASGLLGLRQSKTGNIESSTCLIPYLTWIEATGRTNNNPVVIRAMSQMRKVVNAVCREWGVPDEIHVELSRDLALPKKAKEAIAKANRRNEKDNNRIRNQIAEFTNGDPSSIRGSAIAKWRLWEEQEGRDIYTDDEIDSLRLVTDETYTQIDHILPFSRTGDNSHHNKVLVLAKSNQDKRERSPYEWMMQDRSPDWDSFAARVMDSKNISPRKRSFLLEKDLISREGDFQSRNLTDTAYMAREVCAYLSDCLAFPEGKMKQHVLPVKGTATAWLRRSWGLNFGIAGEKDRSDDRHHATDACVIAACSRSLVIKTAKISEAGHFLSKEERHERLHDAMPWPSFADDVRQKRESVIPTRFVPRLGTGQLFEQTIYAFDGINEQGKALLRTNKGQSKTAGNAIIFEADRSALKVGEMICLRLWFDPKANKNKGKWYADPIYYADLPALQNGTYVPRIAQAHRGRQTWKPIPEHVLALKSKRILLYRGMTIRVGDHIGRYAGFDIDSARWKVNHLITGEQIQFPTIGKLSYQNRPYVIHEDVLGNCWNDLFDSLDKL